MDQITEFSATDYRSFGSQTQTARLTPLSFLVGETGAGKTAFLRLLEATRGLAMDKTFDQDQYFHKLGFFDCVAHQPLAKSVIPDSFKASFSVDTGREHPFVYSARYVDSQRLKPAVVAQVTCKQGPQECVVRFAFGRMQGIVCSNGRDRWSYDPNQAPEDIDDPVAVRDLNENYDLVNINYLSGYLQEHILLCGEIVDNVFKPEKGGRSITQQDVTFMSPQTYFRVPSHSRVTGEQAGVYNAWNELDMPQVTSDGEWAFQMLGLFARTQPDKWEKLRFLLQRFGQEANMFDEIDIVTYDDHHMPPFAIRMRKNTARRKGAWRNLREMSNGVHQILPAVVASAMPQVDDSFAAVTQIFEHPGEGAHPRAMAALGSLMAETVAQGNQFIVETHSDALVDRAIMDMRDNKVGLSVDQVSVSYFEHDGQQSTIHRIEIDDQGNRLGAPNSFRRFERDETSRLLFDF